MASVVTKYFERHMISVTIQPIAAKTAAGQAAGNGLGSAAQVGNTQSAGPG